MTRRGLKIMLTEAGATVQTIPIEEALELAGDPDTVFVDVRERSEVEQSGRIPGALHAPRGFLEFIADPEGPMHDVMFSSGRRLVLYCAAGNRSLLAAKTLIDMGLTPVASLGGGFAAWKRAGGDVEDFEE